MLAQRFVRSWLLLQVVLMASSAVTDDCRYLFTEQPSSVVTCNPYPIGKFVTSCVVEFTTTEGSPLSVAWYTRANIGGIPQPVFGGYSTRNTISSVESELTVQLSDNMVDSFRTYFCRVSFANRTVLSDSREAYLLSKKSLSNDFKICEDGSVQSTKEIKCIDPGINTQPALSTTPPTTDVRGSTMPTTRKSDPSLSTTLKQDPLTLKTMTTTGKDLLTTTADDLPSTSATPSSIRLLTTTISDGLSTMASADLPKTTLTDLPATNTRDQSITTTIASIATTILDLLQTVMPSEKSPKMVTFDKLPSSPHILKRQTTSQPSLPLPESSDALASAQQQPSNGNSPGEPGTSGGSFDDEALLFLTIGAAVFIFIIVCFIIFCCCLWSRTCRECGYNFCCTTEACGCACNCCLDDI